MRQARLGAMHAAAIAAVTSLLAYLPLYGAFLPSKLLAAPLRDVALQAFVQGVLTAIVALVLYGRAVELLGASSGAAIGALCPVMTALLAIPILGELPAAGDWIAIILISAGVYCVSGPSFGRRAMGSGTSAAVASTYRRLAATFERQRFRRSR
jgi:drug/metabolite transporter (DMT)-like permease